MWPTRANTNKVTPQGVLHNYGSTRVVKVSTAACSKLSSLSAEVQSSKPSPDWGWVGVTITARQNPSGCGRHLVGYAEDSWTGSNFGDSSLPLCWIWAHCWRSAKDVCCLNLPPSNNVSFFLPALPVTISAPSITFGTLRGELTILPEQGLGVLLVMLTSCPTWRTVTCTTWRGARPIMPMMHVCASGDVCL